MYSLLEAIICATCQCENATGFQGQPPLCEVLDIAPWIARDGWQGLLTDSQNPAHLTLCALVTSLFVEVPKDFAITEDGPGNGKLVGEFEWRNEFSFPAYSI